MGELFTAKTMPKKDCSQVPKPNGWDDVACERIITDNGLGVYIADARQGDVNGKATIILPQWSDGTLHNPLSQERAKATAAIKGDVAIYVDNPGVELDLPNMSEDVKQALLSGDFKPGSIKQWDAIAQGLDYVGLDFDSVSRVLGASLGAHVASAIVHTAPEEVHLERLDLWETAGLDGNNFLRFVANFLAHGGDGYADILKNNPEWVALRGVNGAKELAKIAIRRTAGLFYYPWAINRHDIGNTIIEAKNRKNPAIDGDTALTILNGTESKVSPSELNNRLAAQLALNGFRRVVRLESEGGVHASQDNIGWWTEAERYSGYEAV